MNKNPYSFKHHNLSRLNVSINGCPTPSGPCEYDFQNGLCIKAYMDLYRGKRRSSNSKRITLEEFRSGYSIFRVDLNSHSDGDHFPSLREGSLRLECRFAEQLKENIVLLAHITLPGCFAIDYTRSIHLS